MVSSVEMFHNHVNEAAQNVESSTLITGYSNTTVWLERTYYYAIEFSKPFTAKTVLPLRDSAEKAPRWVLDFDLNHGEELMIKVALSSTGVEGAKKNLDSEIPEWDFIHSIPAVVNTCLVHPSCPQQVSFFRVEKSFPLWQRKHKHYNLH